MNKHDQNLFAALVHEHADMLLAFIRATIRDPATVDDIFQETLLITWRRFDDYDPAKPLAKWLRGIARKLILAHYSRQKTNPVYCQDTVLQVLDDRIDYIDQKPGDSWNDKVFALSHCLDRLAPSLRQCIELFYHDARKTEEIAKVLQCSREAIKKRLQRARRVLAECLRNQGLFQAIATEDKP